MITLGNVRMISLIPSFMKQDPFVVAVCEAFSPYFNQMEGDNQAYLIVNQIERLGSSDLDELAQEMNCTWYNPADSMEIKQTVLKNAIKVHLLKGTAEAVEIAVRSVFGDGYVEEWFEYDGQPGCFRIVTNNRAANEGQAARLMQIVESVKRKGAHLDEIVVALASQLKMHIGIAIHIGDTQTFRQVI